jgi:hypothetical protein
VHVLTLGGTRFAGRAATEGLSREREDDLLR